MNPSREQVYGALFDLVKNAAGFNTASRKLRGWDDVNGPEFPALFQIQVGENIEQTARGIPPKMYFYADVVVYALSEDPDVPPSIQLNQLVDAIQDALAPNWEGVQTLNNTVSHAWISGRIETDEGVLGEKAVAIIPVEILYNL